MKITCYRCNTDFVVPKGVSLDENLCPGCDAFKALLGACKSALMQHDERCAPEYRLGATVADRLRSAIAKAEPLE